MSPHKNFQPEAAYFPSSKHYLWTSDSKKGSFYRIFCKEVQNISAISKFSGHDKHADDKNDVIHDCK